MIDYQDYILWIQSDTNESEDIILVDGNKPEESLRSSYFGHIFPEGILSKWREVRLGLKRNAPSGVSKSLKLYQSTTQNEVLIMSNFTTLDDKLRRVAYIFCTKNKTSMEQICSQMQQVFKDNGYEVNPHDIAFLIRTVCMKKKIRRLLAVISCFVLIVLAFILWKSHN